MEFAGSLVAKEAALMRTGIHMTIQDYFRKSGLNTGNHRFEIPAHVGSKTGDRLFARILDEKQLSVGEGRNGLSIQDYLAKPVAVKAQMIPDFSMPGAKKNTPPIAAEKTSPLDPPVSSVVSDQESPKEAAGRDRGSAKDVQSRIAVGINKAAKRYDLPVALIRAVVQAESGFQVGAVSPAGAQGLMQLMPGTAKEMGVTDPFDIDQNIDGGSRYLRTMLDRFDGDVRLALSAYNAGPGTVARYNGRVPYAETRNYVNRVLRYVRLSV
jgi:hypothetical protein